MAASVAAAVAAAVTVVVAAAASLFAAAFAVPAASALAESTSVGAAGARNARNATSSAALRGVMSCNGSWDGVRGRAGPDVISVRLSSEAGSCRKGLSCASSVYMYLYTYMNSVHLYTYS